MENRCMFFKYQVKVVRDSAIETVSGLTYADSYSVAAEFIEDYYSSELEEITNLSPICDGQLFEVSDSFYEELCQIKEDWIW